MKEYAKVKEEYPFYNIKFSSNDFPDPTEYEDDVWKIPKPVEMGVGEPESPSLPTEQDYHEFEKGIITVNGHEMRRVWVQKHYED